MPCLAIFENLRPKAGMWNAKGVPGIPRQLSRARQRGALNLATPVRVAAVVLCFTFSLQKCSAEADLKQSTPSWHPRRFGKGLTGTLTYSELVQGVMEKNQPLAPAPENIKLKEHPPIPPWEMCDKCDTCTLGTVQRGSQQVTEQQEQCEICMGCSHSLYAILGKKKMENGIEYKWEPGSSAAHILRTKGYSGTNKSDDDDAFVKFLCVPSTPKHGVTKCNIDEMEEKVMNTVAIQRVVDDCGFDQVSTRFIVDHVKGVMPFQPENPATPAIQGGGKVDQKGIFTTVAPGASISNVAFTNGQGAYLLKEIKSHDVLMSALFDYLFCCMDRHAQNIFLSEQGKITLIDNDLLLGGNQKGRRLQGSCPMPSSLFLPGNLEHFRVHESPTKLWHLDYRCHLPDKDAWKDKSTRIPMPPKLEQCLSTMEELTAKEVQERYGLLNLKIARELRDRAVWLKTLPFEEALAKASDPEKKAFDEMEEQGIIPERGTESFKHYHNNLWRPHVDPKCLW